MAKKQYCILRTRKIKTCNHITRCAEHNFRLRTQRNIDSSQSQNNQILVNALAADTSKSADLQEKLSGYYQSLGIKPKADNVLMMEWLVTATPEFFAGKSQQEISQWAKAQVDFMKTEFGEQIKLAVLHLDEKSPHIHFLVSTEQFTEKQYKNRYGTCSKKSWSLNANRYNPQFLVGLQDRFAAANRKFGLNRGARGSKKKHNPVKEFYKAVDRIKDIDMQPVLEHYLQDVLKDVPLWKRTEQYMKQLFTEAISPVLSRLVNDQKRFKKFVDTNWVQLQEKLIAEKTETKKLLEQVQQEKQSLENLKGIYLPKIKAIDELEQENKQLTRENQRLMKNEAERRAKAAAQANMLYPSQNGNASQETKLRK